MRNLSSYVLAYARTLPNPLSNKAQSEIMEWLQSGAVPGDTPGTTKVVENFAEWAKFYWTGVYASSVTRHRFFPWTSPFMEEYARTAEGVPYKAVNNDGFQPSTRNQALRTLHEALDCLILETTPVENIDWAKVLEIALEEDENGSCLLFEAALSAAEDVSSATQKGRVHIMSALGPQLLEYAKLASTAKQNPAPEGGLPKPKKHPVLPTKRPKVDATVTPPKLSACGRVVLPTDLKAKVTAQLGGFDIEATVDLSDPARAEAWAEAQYAEDMVRVRDATKAFLSSPRIKDPHFRARVLAIIEEAASR